MGFFGAAQANEDFKKSTLRKICHTSYNDEIWNSFALPKKIKKINHVKHFLSSAYISIFFTKNQQGLLHQEIQI